MPKHEPCPGDAAQIVHGMEVPGFREATFVVRPKGEGGTGTREAAPLQHFGLLDATTYEIVCVRTARRPEVEFDD